MCGRYTLHLADLSGLASLLRVRHVRVADWKPRYNVAPTQPAPVALRHADEDGRSLELLRFGLVPAYARRAQRAGERTLAPMINARVETVAELRSFREAFAHRRCVVPATGFYEWMEVEGRRAKQPLWIHPREGDLLSFAGIFEPGSDDAGRPSGTFAIVTADASERLRAIHDRMPLLLTPDGVEQWLEGARLGRDELRRLVARAHEVALEARPVSVAVSSPRNDEPRCIAPIEPSSTASGPAEDDQLDLF